MKFSSSWIGCVFLPLLMLSQTSSCQSSKPVTTSSPTNQSSTSTKNAVHGSWGGADIALEVTNEGIDINFDCAHGHIDESIVPDSEGNFSVKGTYVREHGGPMRSDENANSLHAVYKGKVTGDKMTLTLTFPDGTEDVGPFTLERGKEPRIHKCM